MPQRYKPQGFAQPHVVNIANIYKPLQFFCGLNAVKTTMWAVMLLLKLYSSVFYDYKFLSAVSPEKNMFMFDFSLHWPAFK